MRFSVIFILLLAAWPARAAPPDFALCAHTVELLDPRPEQLRVTVECRGDGPFTLSGWRAMPDDHIRDMAALAGSRVERAGRAWRLTGSGGVAGAQYRFDMVDLTGSTNSFAIGRYVGGSLVTSVTSFLIVPAAETGRLAIRFVPAEGSAVATPFAERQGWLVLAAEDFPRTGYIVMGRFEWRRIMLPGGGSLAPAARRPAQVSHEAELQVVLLDAPMELSLGQLEGWIRRIGMETARYWEGFPVDRALLVLNPVQDGGGLFRGHVLAGGGASILLHIGRYSEMAGLLNHWMLTHEMAHLGSPEIVGNERWFSEGMAVYVDALVRARAGLFDPRALWAGWHRNLPRGAPVMEQGGLASARGVRAVYWGGALFMMLADVEIRRRTGNAFSLDDCLRGVLWTGGDGTARWPLARVVETCDRTTGVPVMAELVARHHRNGAPVDLAALWRVLGVTVAHRSAVFDDDAPLAHIRRAQTSPDGR